MLDMLRAFIIALRPHQWYKNLVVFMGIIFAGDLLDISLWFYVILAFGIFCAASGCLYLINDLIDKERDRLHPKKSQRPIASGRLPESYAIGGIVFLGLLTLIGAYSINRPFLLSTGSFLILGLAYSAALKNIHIVDVITVSSQFVIRAAAGALAINVFVSPWLIVGTFFLALFLVIGKRRDEFLSLATQKTNHRSVLAQGSEGIYNQMLTIAACSLVLCYALYTFLVGKLYMMVTIPLLVYGVFRYMYLIDTSSVGGEPGSSLRDKGLIACLLIWILLVIVILYGTR
jgi:4-hydroxybenzoate polyprenyltransferase